MANDKNGRSSKNGKVEFKGFFNPQLNKDIKVAVRALNTEGDATIARCEELLGAGYKMSCISDKAGTHYTGTLFDKRPDSDSQGYVLSCKHSQYSIVVALMWFLHFEIYEGKSWPTGKQVHDEVDW